MFNTSILIDIQLVKEDKKKKSILCVHIQFFMENTKIKRKQDKKFDLPQQGFEPRIFEQDPAQSLNFERD